jgi:hypothetical protein
MLLLFFFHTKVENLVVWGKIDSGFKISSCKILNPEILHFKSYISRSAGDTPRASCLEGADRREAVRSTEPNRRARKGATPQGMRPNQFVIKRMSKIHSIGCK